MRKYFSSIILFAGVSLLIIFAINVEIRDPRNFNGNFLAAIGLQNVISSQSTAPSTSNDTSTANSTMTLADALQRFQDQTMSLNNQLTDLRSEIEITNLRGIFTRTLKRGDSGDDVSKLQELLMKFQDLYPLDTDISGTVTGFYGSLTKAAVMKFQSQTGLQETGIFDSVTKEKFYESISALPHESTSTEFTPIDISSIAGLKNSDGSSSQNSTNTEADNTTPVTTVDLQNQISQLSSDLTNVKSEVTDLQNQLTTLQPIPPSTLYSASSPTPTPSPTPTSPPTPTLATVPKLAISNIQVTNIAQQSATIIWTSNVPSTNEVDYSTDSSLSATKTLIVSSSTQVTNHTAGLTNLIKATKYYYRVLSKDSTNTTVSSVIQSFNTLN